MCSYEESIKQEGKYCLKKMDCGGKLKRDYTMLYKSRGNDRDSNEASRHSGKNESK
jgi:hypothetical protein